MSPSMTAVAYIAATILFILSLGGLSNPETARRGNLFGMVGMTLAVLATVFGPRVTPAGYPWIIGALVQIAPPVVAAMSGGARPDEVIRWLAVAGIALTAVNMFGGFAVTQRMLSMFQK